MPNGATGAQDNSDARAQQAPTAQQGSHGAAGLLGAGTLRGSEATAQDSDGVNQRFSNDVSIFAITTRRL
jgi:hypothetical protein